MASPEPVNPFASPAVAETEAVAGGGEADLWQASVELDRTGGWVRLVALIGFLTAILMVLGAVAMMVAAGRAGNSELLVLGVTYVVMAGVYCIGGALLWKYAGRITQFVRDRSPRNLEQAVEAQASFWRFSGIVTLASIVLYTVLILGMRFVLAA